MQNPKTSPPRRSDSKNRPSGITTSLLVAVGLCIIILLGLYLSEVVPRYIVLALPPPEDSYNRVGWTSTTWSVWTTSSADSSIPAMRAFIWRRDATLVYETEGAIPTLDMLVTYFDERLSKQGWVQSGTSIPCNIYLPEAAFLMYGSGGYISYHKIGDTISSDEIPMGDTICLAIWNDEGQSNVLRIVLLTAKRSLFTNFYNLFD